MSGQQQLSLGDEPDEPKGAPVPAGGGLDALRQAAAGCRACELWEPATQTVFGEGRAHAPLMVVGEQPGDQEDRQGHPFVGPAGGVFDRGCGDAGIDRAAAYVTNAVKHFRFQERGQRRIHQRPESLHIRACKPWLQAEVERVAPRVVLLMGAVATQSLLGSAFKVTKDHGRALETELDAAVFLTVHPSSILRAPDEEARAAAYEGFVADLRAVAAAL